jgi:hypothetical protein
MNSNSNHYEYINMSRDDLINEIICLKEVKEDKSNKYDELNTKVYDKIDMLLNENTILKNKLELKSAQECGDCIKLRQELEKTQLIINKISQSLNKLTFP